MVKIRDLFGRWGEFTLDVPALDVAAGEYLVLLGPTGAGKSLLLSTLAGLARPQRGQVWLGGQEVTHWPPERRNLGLVAQRAGLFPHLTVRQNVAFGLRYHRARRAELQARMAHLVEMLNLGPLLERNVRDLSGGEQQRVALARALAVEPPVLLLDEPLGRLDPNARQELQAELRRLHDTLGMTTLHVTHDRAEAWAVADQVGIMAGGRLLQMGPPGEVFRRPATAWVARFVGIENIVTATAQPGPDGLAWLRIGDAEIRAVTDRHGEVRACLRPEAITLRPPQPSFNPSPGPTGSSPLEVNRLQGLIRLVREEGSTVRVELEAAGQRWVIQCSHRELAEHGWTVGSFAQATFEPTAVHVLAGEDNGLETFSDQSGSVLR